MTIKDQMPGEMMIPRIIRFDNKVINVKLFPKTIQVSCPTMKTVTETFRTLEEYDNWWRAFKKNNPRAARENIRYVRSINGLFVIQRRLAQKLNPYLS